jgi:hypothetical protein
MAAQDQLLAHLISRLESDINFLTSQGHISHSDAQTVLGVLSRAGSNSSSVDAVTAGMGAMGFRGMPAPYGGAPTPPAAAAPVSYSSPPASTPAPAPASYGNAPPPAFPGGPPAGGAPYMNTSSPSPVPFGALKRAVPPPPPPPAQSDVQAKALWDYNLNGQVGWMIGCVDGMLILDCVS